VKKRIWILILVLLVLPVCTHVFAASGNFDAVKSLVGNWKGKAADGKEVQLTYSLISGGTAVMERMQAGQEEMMTTYYPDGNSLMLTHYCMANNQPRMRAASSDDAKRIVFTYVDATNLASPDAGHMKQLVLTVQDKDHISQEWTWSDKGQQKVEAFQLTRVQ
jgi:hypothetical protein